MARGRAFDLSQDHWTPETEWPFASTQSTVTLSTCWDAAQQLAKVWVSFLPNPTATFLTLSYFVILLDKEGVLTVCIRSFFWGKFEAMSDFFKSTFCYPI